MTLHIHTAPTTPRFNRTHAERQAARKTAHMLLNNLSACILYLLDNGIAVESFSGKNTHSDELTITVRACPQLYLMFKDDCAWRERRFDGIENRFSWFAQRFGVRIQWEDIE